MTGKYAPKDTVEATDDAKKIDAMLTVLELTGQLDKFKEKFGIKALEVKIDKLQKKVDDTFLLLVAIQEGLEDEA